MAKNKILQAVVDVAGSVDPSLGKAAKEATGFLDKINLKGVATAAAVAGAAVAVGKAVFEAGKYLADLGGQFDEVADSIRVGTGATGDALDGLLSDFDEVYKSVPTTMEDAGKAIADYNTRLGLTGPVLQDLSKQALQVSDMFDEDLNTVIEGSSQAFQQWSIDSADMGDAMDHIFKVSQSTGTGFNDLMSNMQKFGPQLQELGYSFEEASALMGQLEKAGVNTEEVLGAMKKSVGALAKEGISASDGIAMYFEEIQNAGTAAEAAAIASEVFGARAGSTMSAAIRDGTLSVADFTAELMANGETISGAAEDTYDFAERLQMFKQNAEVALKPLANTMFDSLNSLMPAVTSAMETFGPAIADVTAVIAPLITDLFSGLLPVIESILPIIIDLGKNLLAKLLPPIMKIISALLPALMSLLEALAPILDVVIALLGPILEVFTSLIVPIIDLITTAISPLIGIISELINTVLTPLIPIIQQVGQVFSSGLTSAISVVMPIIENLKGIFSGLIDFISNVFTGNWAGAWEAVKSIFSNIISGLSGIFKAPINFIINGINKFIGGLNNLKIPGWVPGIGGKGFNIPLIPQLAAGGFTDGISIAGEAGVEAVISFDPAHRADNLSYWAQAGRMLGIADESSLMNLSGAGGSTIVYQLGSVSFAPKLIVSGQVDEEKIMQKLKDEEMEFFDMLEAWWKKRGAGRYEFDPAYS